MYVVCIEMVACFTLYLTSSATTFTKPIFLSSAMRLNQKGEDLCDHLLPNGAPVVPKDSQLMLAVPHPSCQLRASPRPNILRERVNQCANQAATRTRKVRFAFTLSSRLLCASPQARDVLRHPTQSWVDNNQCKAVKCLEDVGATSCRARPSSHLEGFPRQRWFDPMFRRTNSFAIHSPRPSSPSRDR